jgi:molybdopterin-containing oxidoreductase family membrane subunit
MISCNVIFPQLFWFKAVRTNVWAILLIGMIVNVGMWFERFVIICTSLTRDFLPSSWGYYIPTKFDFMTLGGSFGLFFTLFLLFCRYLPMVAMSEVKAFSPAGGHARPHLHHGHDDEAHAHH